VDAGTTRGVSLSFPELNRHVEDPLARSSHVPDSLLSNGWSHIGRVEVPPSMQDLELDLTRCAAPLLIWTQCEAPTSTLATLDLALRLAWLTSFARFVGPAPWHSSVSRTQQL
jgi:hypothetical protein